MALSLAGVADNSRLDSLLDVGGSGPFSGSLHLDAIVPHPDNDLVTVCDDPRCSSRPR